VRAAATPGDPLAALRAEAATICDLRGVVALLVWDQQTAMPSGATVARAKQRAAIERAIQERLASPELGRLLEEVRQLDDDGDAAALVRVLDRERRSAVRVSVELRGELVEAAALAQSAWVEARERSSFAHFRPFLERNVELRRSYADCFPELEDPYDAQLDEFDPGARSREVAPVLEELKRSLVPIVRDLRSGEVPPPGGDGPFPVDRQRELTRSLLERMGLDSSRARVVESPHPMTVAMGRHDVGVTTRYSSESLEGVFLALHELGHALYEQRFGAELDRSPLAQGAAASMHEAQARLLEKRLGQSSAFLRFLFPQLRAAFPDALGKAELEDFSASLNSVRRSPIRLKADELTYNLHIVIRFELERDLLAGTLAAGDLPDAWADLYDRYLGVEVSDDAGGVLQDVQWAFGAFGYFPTYALGNVIAAQLWDAIELAVPTLADEIAEGDLGSLLGWLTEHVWRHGRRYPSGVLLERAVGSGIDAGPYIAYLERKFTHERALAVH
jgi:carboxypeptidase Taq